MKLLKTKKGQEAFNARSEHFTSLQRNAFILFDGQKTVAEVLAAMAPLGLRQSDLDDLRSKGFLAPVRTPLAAVPLADAPRQTASMDEQERYLLAKPLATQLTATLGIMGFRLNLAVEAASGTEDLRALLPKIQAAVGVRECQELERVLKG